MTPAHASLAARVVTPAIASESGPPTVQGKFFWTGGREVLHAGGVVWSVRHRVTRRPVPGAATWSSATSRSSRELGANYLRTFTVPPRWLLDRAEAHGLRVLIGIPWAEHVCFLDSPETVAEIRETIAACGARLRQDIRRCSAYLVGNEIPPDIVRWYGPERVQEFLRELGAT